MELKRFPPKITGSNSPEVRTFSSASVKANIAANVSDVSAKGKELFTKRAITRTNTPTSLVFYRELTALRNDGRGFGAENAAGSTYTFQHSKPYGPQLHPELDNMFMYQRLGVYKQTVNGRKEPEILAWVHIIDPGSNKGPGKTKHAFLNAGLLFMPDGSVCRFEADMQGLTGGQISSDPTVLREWTDELVYQETLELENTHVKETAFSPLDRTSINAVRAAGQFTRQFVQVATEHRRAPNG